MNVFLEESDVVSLHCPPTKNMGMINSEFLKKMKKNVILVNTAKSKILSYFDCLEKLLREHLKFHALLKGPPRRAIKYPPSYLSFKLGKKMLIGYHQGMILTHIMHIFQKSLIIDMRRDIVATRLYLAYIKIK
nr:NAD(P)-dependent oxidoreductase [Bartonella senegalensis]